MVNRINLLTILLMACATYATRAFGYTVLSNRVLSARTKAVLDAAPGCVLIAVIAPAFVSPRKADLIALGITLAAAWRLPMVATVAIAIVSSATLRFILP